MKIRAELHFRANICLHDRLRNTQVVMLGLWHQRFWNSWNRRFHFYRSIRIDIGDLGVAKTEDINQPMIGIIITGNRSPNDKQSGFIPAELQFTEFRKISNQVSSRMVRGAQGILHGFPYPIENYNNVFFLIKIKVCEFVHVGSCLPDYTTDDRVLSSWKYRISCGIPITAFLRISSPVRQRNRVWFFHPIQIHGTDRTYGQWCSYPEHREKSSLHQPQMPSPRRP